MSHKKPNVAIIAWIKSMEKLNASSKNGGILPWKA